jgi:hypothetical protein
VRNKPFNEESRHSLLEHPKQKVSIDAPFMYLVHLEDISNEDGFDH